MPGSPLPSPLRALRDRALLLSSTAILVYLLAVAIALAPAAGPLMLLTEALLFVPYADATTKLAGAALLATAPAYLIVTRESLQRAIAWVLGQRPAKDPRGIIQERHPDWDAHVLDELATRIEALADDGSTR